MRVYKFGDFRLDGRKRLLLGRDGTTVPLAPKAFDTMTNDAAFKLAFENKFDRNGIYCAEIPLSAKRKGAYGVLSDG